MTMKRIFLFVLTNLAIMLVLGVVLQVLGIESILKHNGSRLDVGALLAFSAVFGMGGAFISLALSKWIAKMATGARVIEHPSGAGEVWLIGKVQQLSQAAGIRMPEVAIFDSPSPNAFATGARRDRALVAVSTGLLRQMNEAEIEAVLGHEITHVANGDMVTLTLIQGVVNTFVIFLSRLVGYVVDRVVFKTERGHGPAFFVTSLVCQLLFGILASLIVCAFARRREFRADSGGAQLTSRERMIAALERLRGPQPAPLPESLTAFGIASGGGRRALQLFSTHPPLEERIQRLREAAL
jgi:heat shock protein HtpX